MKNIFITLVLFSAVSFSAQAQYEFPEWGIGGSVGMVRPYSDTRINDTQRAFALDLFWNYSPYLPFSFEAQTGRLAGGGATADPYGRFFVNDYLALDLHGDLQLGEVVDFQGNFLLERLKGFYSGIGVGAMFNNLTSIQRVDPTNSTYIFPGKEKSVSILVPLRWGYEFKVFNYYDVPIISINLNYTHYLTFAESLDGYDDPSSKFKNNAQDMYRYISVGVKLNFGNTRQYFKPIR
ncbi:porin family protein [Mucilaginibacter myungsuensis]|uniref:Outer membrane protein with beta-barrel domain n=1 Tax=Mucilaginibacter myungsuensis TaxID=649104 RepID=A0A929PVP4_9SPHI|nr:hypothetical protein [Mucilaginibacter myungsuensis]MBE9661339.1 hypothetical protein [Mucilaginibacter myungsuensis]MDN3597482.1 hypothetical protein [Mucilaginibacter myungsuensis]